MKLLNSLSALPKAISIAFLFCVAGVAGAQDWPNLQGGDARTGINSNPGATTPGDSYVTWFAPSTGTGTNFVRHIMSPTEASATPAITVPRSNTNPVTGWVAYGPADFASEAGNYYDPIPTGNATEDTFSGYSNFETLMQSWLSNTSNPEPYDYAWTNTIASSTNPSQPTVKLNAGDSLNTFTWQVQPAQAANRVANNYALYAWVPTGPTADTSGNVLYPAQYFVFTITYGSGSVYTDVVDTSIMGGGWVRLGNAGFPTNRTFAYNGTTPIQITLYNTIPRDPTGNLLGNTSQVVYADAVMAVAQSGFYDSSPIVSAFDPSTGLGTVHTVAAENQYQVAPNSSGTPTTITTGTVTSYNYNDGTVRWHWSPGDTESTVMTALSSGVTFTSPWATNSTAVGQKGTSWLGSPISNDSTNVQYVLYQPTLTDGNYSIQVWIPGSGGGQTFAQGTTYYIDEGSTESGPFTINQDTAAGWVTLGTRLYTENNSGGQPLVVKVSNYSALSSDSTRTAFTDAVQFIGQTNLAIESTPIQTTIPIVQTVGGTPVSTAVTIVADENGRIYCLDSTGDGHGGTTLYWAYPSLPTVSPDPNQVTGLDGPGPTAQMPTNFSTSTALVETLSGHPYLYIASQNGRVYCLDMEGRGDTTTTREWSYPDDYPSTARSSNLGPITGSLAFVNDGTTAPAVIVPAQQGRIYSLDAIGNQTTKTTFTHWTYPNGNETDSFFGTLADGARGSGDAAWTNPTNAQYTDQTYATVTPDLNGGSGFSQYLEGTAGTSLNVPGAATISGIEVIVTKHRSGGDSGLTIKDQEVELIKGGTVQNGTNQNRADLGDDWSIATDTIQETGTVSGGSFTITAGALGTTSALPYNATAAQVQTALNAIAGLSVSVSGTALPNGVLTVAFNSPSFPPPTLTITSSLTGTNPGATITPSTDQVKIYGGETDLWGQTWTPADFGASFGVALALKGNGNSSTNTVLPTAGVDSIQVRVFYGASATLGPIVATPTVAFGNIYFGTRVEPGDTSFTNSGFFAINQDTGALQWQFNGTSLTQWNGTALGDFQSGAVAVPATELQPFATSAGISTTQTNTVVAMNENLYLTAFDAATGNVEWTTNELGSGVYGNLAYVQMNVYNNTSTTASPTRSNAPVVMVPTEDGRFDAIFALNDGNIANGTQSGSPPFGAKNQLWTRSAWEYKTPAPSIKASFANAHGFMYAADTAGYLYAFSNTPGSGGSNGPGSNTETPNTPGANVYAADFENAYSCFISPSMALQAREGTLNWQALRDYRTSHMSAAVAKDYGQSLYVAVFHFPYSVISSAGGYSMANVQQSSSTQSALATSSANSIHLSSSDGTYDTGSQGENLDGVAIVHLFLSPTLNSPGPGPVQIQISMSVAGSSSSGTTNVAINPAPFYSYLTYTLGNPLALVMNWTNSTTADSSRQIGFDSLTSTGVPSPQDTLNGNPSSASTAGDNVTQLTASGGTTNHGTSTTVKFDVINRSLLPNGLPNVHLVTDELAYQGTSVINPLPTAFSGFEDLPLNTPNNSMDYPNIHRDQITAVSDPNGTSYNPLYYSGAVLKPATNYLVGGTAWSPLNDDPYTPVTRTLNPTEWDVTAAVPRFQPPNQVTAPDSAGASQPAGYRGLFTIYAGPSNTTGTTTITNQAYRTFWMDVAVPVDQRFYSSTPTVDLGALSGGAGTGINNDYSPWAGSFQGMFQPFNITNVGNVNLINLGLSKYFTPSTHMGINATNGNNLSWLDSYIDLHTDIDSSLSLSTYLGYGTSLPAILQKARVGSTSGTTFTDNPIRQANSGLGVTQGPLFDGNGAPTPSPAKVTVAVPFGFPVGTYTQPIQIEENDNTSDPTALTLGAGGDPVGTALAQPTFNLTFRVKETGLTGKANPFVDTVLDNYLTGTETNLYSSTQPAAFRDNNNILHVAFTSSRGSYSPASGPTSGQTSAPGNSSMIYIASLASVTPSSANQGQNPLADLDWFTPANTSRWFSQDQGPYPSTAPSTLFIPGGSSYSLNTNAAVTYSSPAFPASPYNPFAVDGSGVSSQSSNGNPVMVFTGQAQVNTGNALVTNSKVFMAVGSSSGAMLSMGTPVALPDSLSQPSLITGTIKEHPTVVQVGSGNATVFYGTGGTGQGQFYCATATISGSTPTWTSNNPISLPAGFDSVANPQAAGRVTAGGQDYLELTFQGKLVSRPHSDVWFARIPCNANGIPTQSPIVLTDLDAVSEQLTSPKSGLYQASGVDWDVSQPVSLTINGTALNTQPQVDPKSGIIAQEDNILGGTVYFDPNMGTVQFSGSAPAPNAKVVLNYTPKILRVSSGNITALNPSVMYDTRPLGGSDLNGWYSSTGGALPSPAPEISASRFVFTYGGSSSGGGQAARPYVSTYRFGVRLPIAIQTNNTNGAAVSLTVSGNNGPYQIDPVNGRIYFTSADEGNTNVQIAYTGVDATGNAVAEANATYAVKIVPEAAETPVAVDTPVNEAQVTSFLDPIVSAPSATSAGRPGLIWLFWTSTRNGSPDVFFETIAPNLAPTLSTH